MKTEIKSKSKYKFKKYYTGTGDLKTEYDDLSAPEAKRMGGAQSVADGVGSIPVVGAFKTVGEGVGNAAAQRDEYGIAKSTGGAAVGSVFNPLPQTSDLIAGKGGVKGMLGNALIIGGAINKEKELKQRKVAAQNRVDLYNRDAATRNVDIDQIGYAKHGLDMTGDKTKYKLKANKIVSNEPIYTQQERQDLNLLKGNPVVYKEAWQNSINYKPIGSGPAFRQKNEDLYNQRVALHNQRDTTVANSNFNFQPYLNKVSTAAIQNNLNYPSTNKRLDKFVVNGGGEVSNMGGGIYKQGTQKVNTKMIKPVEVEGDEILMEKSKGKYKMKADFKDGPSHEEGGIPIVAKEGDIIYPANKRNQVVAAYNDDDHSKLESIRKTLPTDTKYKYKKGVGGLDLGGDGAGDGTTVGALQGLTTAKSTGISDSKNKTFSKMGGSKTNWGKIGSTAAEFAPIAYNIGKGLFDKSVKTNRRLYNPNEFQYTDISQPIRNEAENAYTGEKDQIRNSAGGSSSMYLANQSLANSRKYQRLQEINNNEGGRKVAVANMNTELNNNSKMTNLNLQNQYDELDLRNDAAKKKHLTDGFSQLSTAAQNRQKMRNMADADDIRARTLKDMVANYGFDPNALKDKDKELYNFKLRKGNAGIKGVYKMKKPC